MTEKQTKTRKGTKKSTKMEAYHPHLKRQKTNFKEYISEFILIFVAITGGFFMENFRERIVEHHKEKEYMVRLIRDIKQDTLDLKNIINWNNRQMAGLDSLSAILEKPVSEIPAVSFISLISENLNDFHLFTPRDITMSQLKNTGNLRLIENTNVSDSIIFYYNTIEYYKTLGTMNSKFMEETFNEEMKYLDFNQILKTGQLNLQDPSKLKELDNRCFVYKIQIRAYNNNLTDIYNQGTSLINFLQKEYRFR
jgi:hypothetical protein